MKNLIQLVQIFLSECMTIYIISFFIDIATLLWSGIHSIFFISNHFDHHSVGINLITSQP